MILPFKIDLENLPYIDDKRGRHRTSDKFPVIHGIYKITSESGAIYIGLSTDIYFRICNCYKKMKCKQQLKIYNSLNKYGIESHTFEIIHILDILNLDKNEIRAKLNNLEFSYVKKFNSFYGDNDLFGLNLSRGGDSMELTNEARESIRIKNTGKTIPPETIAKIIAKNTGKKRTDETKEKMRQSALGKIVSDEAKANMSKAQTGKKRSKESIEKQSNSTRGLKRTEEQKEKMRGKNNPNYGKPVSEETKEKIRKTLTGKYVGENSPSFGMKRSPETLEKLSKAKKGIIRSEESKKKQGDSIRGKKHHNYGKKASEETIKKLSESHKGQKLSEESKKKQSDSIKAAWAKRKAEGKPWRKEK